MNEQLKGLPQILLEFSWRQWTYEKRYSVFSCICCKCVRDHGEYPVESTTDTVNIASGQSEVTCESPGTETEIYRNI